MNVEEAGKLGARSREVVIAADTKVALADGAKLFGVIGSVEFEGSRAILKCGNESLLEGEPSTYGRIGALRNLLERLSCGLDDEQWEVEVCNGS